MMMEKGLYLLEGTDQFQIKKQTEALLVEHKISREDVEFYDMEEVSLSDAVASAMTIPFFSDRKGVILSNAIFMAQNRSGKEIPQALETLEAYIKNPSPTTLLIIQAPYEKLDRSRLVVKAALAKAEVIHCEKEKGDDLFKEIRDRLQENQLRIDANALQLFVSRIGSDHLIIDSELTKLMTYAFGKDTITIDMVRQIVYKNAEEPIYQLVNAVIDEDKMMLIHVYRDLLSSNVDPLWMLGAIIAKFQEILHAKELLRLNRKHEDIMAYFQASKGRAYYIMKNAKEVSNERLFDILSRLETLDAQIKSGQMDKGVGLELFLMRLYER
jgi:DNA polymerase-3 subunit delta